MQPTAQAVGAESGTDKPRKGQKKPPLINFRSPDVPAHSSPSRTSSKCSARFSSSIQFLGGALMNVEYTGRHYVITSLIRKEVETGLTKIRKILGDRFETKVILAVEKHRHKAEITISPRNGPLVGLAQAKDMTIAVNEALDHLEKQAVKYKTRWQSKKRSARKSEEVKKWNGHSPEADQADLQTVIGLSEKTAVPVMVHKY